MRQIVLGVMALLGGAWPVLPAAAETGVVVELYTSQGCSSCPPADALLTQIAGQEGVIALALHVDYWDYIGWEDTFASPRFSDRQYAYAKALGERMVYTPQIIVQGTRPLMGHSPDEVAAAIADARQAPQSLALSARRQGQELRVDLSAAAGAGVGASFVQLVRFRPAETVAIERGENAGSVVAYSNIVTSWERLADWDGQSALVLTAPLPGSDPAVVIVQRMGPRAILSAYRLD